MNVPLAFDQFTNFHLGNGCSVSTDCEAYHACVNDTECVRCDKVCIEDSSPYDRFICGEDCQDYLHDFIYQYTRRRDVDDMLSEYCDHFELVVIIALLCMGGFILITLGLIIYLNYGKKILRMFGIGRQQLSQVENADDETTSTPLLGDTNPFCTPFDQETADDVNVGCSSVWDEVFDDSVFVSSDDNEILIPEVVTPTLNEAETKL